MTIKTIVSCDHEGCCNELLLPLESYSDKGINSYGWALLYGVGGVYMSHSCPEHKEASENEIGLEND